MSTMDQFPEFIAYKQFLQRNNFSMLIQSTPYNFTGAQDILEEFTGTFYSFNNFQDVVLVTLYVPIFITALVGNVLIMVSVLNDVTWRKAKNVFLFNLSVADLSVALICMPMAVGTLVYRLWIYGEFLCKFTAFMQGKGAYMIFCFLTSFDFFLKWRCLRVGTTDRKFKIYTYRYVVVY